jgi:UDP-N-acetylmuramoyl-L-alanyl-D-glutamate--2,6-diaminopimelate ligase
MAREAAARSEQLILTSDNPRFEKPADILHDMEEGLDAEARSRTLIIADRREAIAAAAAMAGKGDVILIAGKGHEDYQEIEGVKHHFDDREVVREIFKTLDD